MAGLAASTIAAAGIVLSGGHSAGAATIDTLITDPNLRACVLDALGSPAPDQGDPTVSALTSLDCSSRGIVDLTGLDVLTGLTSLELLGNAIVDPGPLATGGLSGLTYLDLSGNAIEDPSALASGGLSNLLSLSLSDNVIEDPSSLATGGLSSLESLSLAGNLIVDPSGLAQGGLETTLTGLYLDGNLIVDPSGLAAGGLSSLYYLSLVGNQIVDPSGLATGGLSSLESLSLAGNQIVDPSSLATGGLSSLYYLSLAGNQIVDPSGLAQGGLETTLTQLYLDGNLIVDPSGLATGGLSNLTELSLNSNMIEDPSSLATGGLSSLESLSLAGNLIVDPSGLAQGGLPILSVLDLNHNTIADASSLGGMTQLTQLDLSDNLLLNVAPLSDLVGSDVEVDAYDQSGGHIDAVSGIPFSIPAPISNFDSSELFVTVANCPDATVDGLGTSSVTVTLSGGASSTDCRIAWGVGSFSGYFDVTVTPAEASTATVTFETTGGSPVPGQTVAIGGNATAPVDPTWAQHTFYGWYLPDGTPFDFSTTIDGPTTLYAAWILDAPEFDLAASHQTSISGTALDSLSTPGRVVSSVTVYDVTGLVSLNDVADIDLAQILAQPEVCTAVVTGGVWSCDLSGNPAREGMVLVAVQSEYIAWIDDIGWAAVASSKPVIFGADGEAETPPGATNPPTVITPPAVDQPKSPDLAVTGAGPVASLTGIAMLLLVLGGAALVVARRRQERIDS